MMPQYIVSLTSYGKRLADTAPHAITTLLNQNVKPDKVVLWVADDDKKRISPIMENLVEKGLEIRFCKDIKSFTKLIPALKAFPDDYIITADDDVYYPQNWFKQLLDEHKKNHKKIICHRAHGIRVDESGRPLQYLLWRHFIKPNRHQSQIIFPTGVGGILYPPNCFHKDITNDDLFMKLSPMADDIWYWAMAVINREYFGDECPYIIVENGYSQNLQDVKLLQKQDGNALWNYNFQGGNDKQLKAVIEHYPQVKECLQKIKPTKRFLHISLNCLVLPIKIVVWIRSHYNFSKIPNC
jgi:hypothetical protein